MNLDFRFYWALLLRRMPVMLLFVLVCSGLGVVTALQLPEPYTTSARLLGAILGNLRPSWARVWVSEAVWALIRPSQGYLGLP